MLNYHKISPYLCLNVLASLVSLTCFVCVVFVCYFLLGFGRFLSAFCFLFCCFRCFIFKASYHTHISPSPTSPHPFQSAFLLCVIPCSESAIVHHSSTKATEMPLVPLNRLCSIYSAEWLALSLTVLPPTPPQPH